MSQDIVDALVKSITDAIPDAQVQAEGGGGHYTVSVVSTAFVGKNMVQSHQLVYKAITPLMKGDNAPVHAIDKMETREP